MQSVLHFPTRCNAGIQASPSALLLPGSAMLTLAILLEKMPKSLHTETTESPGCLYLSTEPSLSLACQQNTTVSGQEDQQKNHPAEASLGYSPKQTEWQWF